MGLQTLEFQIDCFQVKLLIKTSNYGRSKMIFVIEKHIILSPETTSMIKGCVAAKLSIKRCADDRFHILVL